MTENTEKPGNDEVPDDQLEEITGGTTESTEKKVVKKKTTLTGPIEGEATDKDHKEWIDI